MCVSTLPWQKNCQFSTYLTTCTVLFPLNFFDLELDTAYIEHPFQALALIVLLKLFSYVSVSEIILL